MDATRPPSPHSPQVDAAVAAYSVRVGPAGGTGFEPGAQVWLESGCGRLVEREVALGEYVAPPSVGALVEEAVGPALEEQIEKLVGVNRLLLHGVEAGS